MPPKPPSVASKLKPPKLQPPKPVGKTKHTPKTFSIKKYGKEKSGEKVLIYSESGMGKTTLASMAPDNVFFPFDDGCRKIKHPITGDDLTYIENNTQTALTFEDTRDALHSPSLFDNNQSMTFDTITMFQALEEPFIFENIRKVEANEKVTNLEGYGWGKGYKHLVDHMRMFLQDLQPFIDKGKHIILLAQKQAIRVANPAGEDYIQDGPDLFHSNQHSVRNEIISWVDHVLKIGYLDMSVAQKKASGSGDRVIYIKPRVHFVAKSRTLNPDDYDLISFASPSDDSFWKILLGEK